MIKTLTTQPQGKKSSENLTTKEFNKLSHNQRMSFICKRLSEKAKRDRIKNTVLKNLKINKV